jgi:hypothetical protein
MNDRIILPKMSTVSRNCRLTQELHAILQEKLTPYELDMFLRWLQVVEEEKQANKRRY